MSDRAHPSSETPQPGTPYRADVHSRRAGVLLFVEAALLVGFSVWIVVASLGHSDAGRVISEAVTLVVLAALGGLLARGLSRGNGFAKTPALIWHLIVMLSGIWIASSGQQLAGVLLAVAGLVGLWLTGRTPNAEL